MNKIDEGLGEFEFSSGWKKMIKDNSRDRVNEEFKVKIEDMQLKLENLNSAIINLSKGEMVKEKISLDDIKIQQIIIKKVNEFEASIAEMKGDINNIQSELSEYKKLMDNRNSILSDIINILRSREDAEASVQKGFIANIFKKK